MAMQGGARRLLGRLVQGLGPASEQTFGGAFGAQNFINGELGTAGSRNASQLAVKNRMKSVKNIQKITKAMKMVAASKLRRAQEQLEKTRSIWQPFTALLGDAPATVAEKSLTITVSSDKGLCGGINSTAVKYTRAYKRWLDQHDVTAVAENPKPLVDIAVLGEKGKAQLQRDLSKSLVLTAVDYSRVGINFSLVCEMIDQIMKEKEYDVYRVIFNRFASTISFQPTVATVLSATTLQDQLEGGGSLEEYEFEGTENGAAEVLQDLSEFHLASVLYNGLVENATSEQGARMSAMDSSTRNASEVLEKLTLNYNRSRQAAITTELIEIISGAAALEAGND
ncbi:F0F1-type ATP synthase gamma subunit [Klebsormidium nitens]|uniref:F-ATPase gamma subunit n=1 Tax=Klebsormidium nitens TaxID=105231 RepID=A0A1Y1I9C6_KLENI|nr:F0F1-type ATP synthase gamma subunit [Klebsormidium nitens]|eukprot:GAQ86562.1 F0F1-type ATP synthase gamma subunit [Klebsormidium nitens]